MRKIIWIAMTSAALFAGACKKKEDSGKAMDQPPTSAPKPQENANEPGKNVPGEPGEPGKGDKGKEEQREPGSAQGSAQGSVPADLSQARDRYRDATKERLAKIDQEIGQIELKTDPASKDTAAKLRTRRDELAARLDTIGDQPPANWDSFKKDTDERLDKLEREANDALKK